MCRPSTAWRDALRPYYDELGVDPAKIAAGASRAPFGEEAAALVEQFRPPVVSFHFGLPPAPLLERVKTRAPRCVVGHHGRRSALARSPRRRCGRSRRALEAGGHRGDFLSDDMTRSSARSRCCRRSCDAVHVPVIAAGGIAEPRHRRRHRARAPAAVQIGTAYLLCPEATTSPCIAPRCRATRAAHTALTNLFTGRPARGIVNRVMRELGPLRAAAPAFPLATAAIAPLRARRKRAATATSRRCGRGRTTPAAGLCPRPN